MKAFARYAISSTVTFATAFLIAVLPFLGSLPWEQSAIFALILTGARAGLNAAAKHMLGILHGMPKDLARQLCLIGL
jgi:hypothetical protein